MPGNPKLEIHEDQFHLARLEKLATPKSARELKRRIQRMLQPRRLPDLLQEVQGWTNFLGAFTRASTGRPITGEDIAEQLKLLTCLIAEGCNIGLTQMALHGPGLTYDQLEETHFNYIREETLQLAAAALVNFHLSQWLPAAWGHGFTSSSDARMYRECLCREDQCRSDPRELG
ncbi:MAG: Tn3 family transposase [Acidobacteria bacterium]|nr:Tn3 family transposase [Acidobacteriota bacterium]